MEPIRIKNPFPGAGAFHYAELGSTMEEARRLTRLGFPPGTVVLADYQAAGRGRLEGRTWSSPKGENLLATVALGPESAAIPGFTLRVGLALARTASIVAIQGGRCCEELPRLKWPNDILVGGKKLAGILCEAGPAGMYVGVGLNLNQRDFGPELSGRATSLALAAGLAEGERLDPPRILELFLENLALALAEAGWREECEALLYGRGEELDFVEGLPGAGRRIRARVLGLAPDGALLLKEAASGAPRAYASGELGSAPGSRGACEGPAEAEPPVRASS